MPAITAIKQEYEKVKELLEYWKAPQAIATECLTLLPLAGLGLEILLPAWPGKAIIGIASGFTVIVLTFFYFVFRDQSPNLVRKVAIGFFIAGILCSLIYLWLRIEFVVEVGGEKHTIGFVLSDEAREAVTNNKVASATANDLLRSYGYESDDRVWKGRGWVIFILILSFAGFFVLFASCFFLLTLTLMIESANSTSTSNPTATTT